MGFTRGKAIVAGVVLAILVVGGGAGVWAMLIRDDAPPPVSLEDAVAAIGTPTAQESDGASATEPTGSTAAEGAPDAPAGSNSVWTIAAGSETFVGYRIGEELATIGTHDAVGRTSSVTGSVEISGTQVVAATIEANVDDLTSDESLRDSTMRSDGLETADFPMASFVLTEPLELGSEPLEGAVFSVVASGDLTLHGVTQPIEIPLEAQVTNGALAVVGSLEIALADYDISKPSSPYSLSIDDRGSLELQLILAQSAA